MYTIIITVLVGIFFFTPITAAATTTTTTTTTMKSMYDVLNIPQSVKNSYINIGIKQ